VDLAAPSASTCGGLFTPLLPLLQLIPFAPDVSSLESIVVGRGLLTESGQRVRFVPPQDDGSAYEARIWERGEVETRPDNWHDFFNALVWITFPGAKAALNARHARSLAVRHEGRGRERDAMTHFDECGVVVVSCDASLLVMIAAFRWKDLFWQRRADLGARLRCFVFGHATYEQLLSPFRGLTAKAVLREVSQQWLQAPLAVQLADIDQRLVIELAGAAHGDPRALHPLPLMGFPGLTPASEEAAYYDDLWQFRPGRGFGRRGRV
jgi:hypothetical protein